MTPFFSTDVVIPTPVVTFVRGFIGSTAGILCSLNGLVADNSINQYNKIEVGYDAHVLSLKKTTFRHGAKISL